MIKHVANKRNCDYENSLVADDDMVWVKCGNPR